MELSLEEGAGQDPAESTAQSSPAGGRSLPPSRGHDRPPSPAHPLLDTAASPFLAPARLQTLDRCNGQRLAK